jgi:hypothetical protein
MKKTKEKGQELATLDAWIEDRYEEAECRLKKKNKNPPYEERKCNFNE